MKILFFGLSVIISGYGVLLFGAGFGGKLMPALWILAGLFFGSLGTHRGFTFWNHHGWFRLLFICGILAFTFLMVWIYSAPTHEKESPYDYLIVLGASVKGERMTITLTERVKKAEQYLKLHPKTKAVLSGGQGPGEDITEAEAMARYLVAAGIEKDRLIKEEASTTTVENIAFSLALVDQSIEQGQEPKCSIVSSRYHIRRGRMIADKLGRPMDGIGAVGYPLIAPNQYVREGIAIIAYVLGAKI